MQMATLFRIFNETFHTIKQSSILFHRGALGPLQNQDSISKNPKPNHQYFIQWNRKGGPLHLNSVNVKLRSFLTYSLHHISALLSLNH